MQGVTNQLLAAGADIVEINTIRKRLSAVKGGRFARHCAPAQVFVVVLSDILGDPLDMIASGPAYPDSSSCAQALDIAKRYGLRLSERAWALLAQETPKTLENVETQITGSVRELCAAAAAACEALGYEPMIPTDCLCCEAREAGSMLASIARTHARDGKNLAFLMGGETVVHLRGNGLGGLNHEIALSAALGIEGLSNALVFSVGSDGTDGPTDAAGGIADGRQLAAALALGACGVQVGTCLLASEECPIHPNYKAALLKAGDSDTIVTGRTVGAPVRVLKNRMSREYVRQEKAGADKMELEKYTLGSLRRAVFEGDTVSGSLMAGQVAGMLHEVRPVADILADLWQGGRQRIAALNTEC